MGLVWQIKFPNFESFSGYQLLNMVGLDLVLLGLCTRMLRPVSTYLHILLVRHLSNFHPDPQILVMTI